MICKIEREVKREQSAVVPIFHQTLPPARPPVVSLRAPQTPSMSSSQSP